MKTITKNLFQSKKNISSFLFIGSFVLFLSSFIIYIYTSETSERELKLIITEISNNISKINSTNQKIDILYSKNSDKLNLKKQIEEMEQQYYTYKTKNTYIDNFSRVLKQQNGINVLRVEYSKTEMQNQLKTNLSIAGSYSTIRDFLYAIEKTFYFSSITSIGIDKADSQVKANIEITTYLGDDLIER